jgi:hypothetical protein
MYHGYDPYLVIRDTREKEGQGWEFVQSGYCSGTASAALKTGDYSLDGFENHLCIERKGDVTELATNITQERFTNMLERMCEYPWRYVLLEFDMDDVVRFPQGTHIPAKRKKYMKIRGPFLLKRILELQREYNVPFIFCGKHGRDVCASIFKRFMEYNERTARG